MRWNKYTINTRTDAEELVCAMLSELGITSVEIDNLIPVPDADRQGGVFEELQPDLLHALVFIWKKMRQTHPRSWKK